MLTYLTRSRRHASPLIYFSYGMQRAGSTLAFELTRQIYEQMGFAQRKLADGLAAPKSSVNFLRKEELETLDRLVAEVERRRVPLVVKLHARPTPLVEQLLAEGRALAHAVCRDPRDLLAALLDAGETSRRVGRESFAHNRTIDETLGNLRRNVKTFEAWAALPAVLPLHYDDVAFETRLTVLRLCDQIGCRLDPAAIETKVKEGRFTQMNKGVLQRWRRDLDAEMADALGAEFAAFIQRYGDERALRAWERLDMYQDGRFAHE